MIIQVPKHFENNKNTNTPRMEPLHCEHHCDLANDNLLLDDENTLLINGTCTTCVRCRKLSSTIISLPYNGDEAHLRLDGSRNIQMYPNGVKCDSRLSIDSVDSPLLLNERSSDCDADEEFHCHFNNNQIRDNKALKLLLAASCMCLFFMVIEIVGGYLANSLSVMTDAAHLLSDFISFLVSLFSICIGQRARTKRMSFGFHRAEILGALFSIMIVWMLTGIFVYLAVSRLINDDYVIDADTMMIVAAIGVIVNIIMGVILHGGCSSIHTHSHGDKSHGYAHLHAHAHTHSHAHSHSSQNGASNINVRAAVIHVIGDFFQSVGVLCAALIIKYYPNAKIADPICTFIFSIIVIFTTRSVLRDTLNVLMEGFPIGVDYNSVSNALAAIDGVQHVHGLHIWSLTLNRNAIAVHLAVDKCCDKEDVLSQATRLVKSRFAITNVTIQIEKYKEDVIVSCVECQLPAE